MKNNTVPKKLKKLLAPAIALTLVLAACSAKTDKSDEAAPTTTEVPETTVVTEVEDKGPERLIPADGVQIDKQAQYAGWQFDFETLSSDEEDTTEGAAGAATDESDHATGPIALEVTFKYTNLTDQSGTPRESMALELAGDDETTELVHPSDLDVAEVPGGGTGKGTLHLMLDQPQAEVFSLDTATIVVGGDDKVEARIPLGTTGELVSLMPQEQKPGFEDFTIGDWKFKVVSTELRWDRITTHEAANRGETWLAVTADVTAGENSSRGSSWEWAVTSPDGLSSTGDAIERLDGTHTGSAHEAGTSVKGYVFWFKLETPVDGEYEFKFTGDFGPDSEKVSKTMKVELKATDSIEADAARSADDADADADSDDEAATDEDEDADTDR